MKNQIIKSLILTLSTTVFLATQTGVLACITQDLKLKFNSSKELVSKLPGSIKLEPNQSLILELPESDSKNTWSAFIDYPTSIDAGTPKNPKLNVIFFDNSQHETDDSTQVKFIQIKANPVDEKLQAIQGKGDVVADATIGFINTSGAKKTISNTAVTRIKVIKPEYDQAHIPKCR